MTNEELETLAEESFSLCLRLLRACELSPLEQVSRIQALNIVATLLIGDEFNWDREMLDKFKNTGISENFELVLVAARRFKEMLEMMRRDEREQLH